MRARRPEPQSGPGRDGPGPALVGLLAGAADISCGVAALDGADLGIDLPSALDRQLARAVAARCGAGTLTVRLDGAAGSVDSTALGADQLRRIVRIDKLPDFFGPRPAGHSCRPVNSLDPDRFLAFFEEVFAPEDLGLLDRSALRSTARELHRGRPVQGRGDYLGRAVLAGSEPVGLFFLAGEGPVRELGFLGAAPGLRRRPGLRGALATGVDWMRADGILALTAEIAVQNSISLALARRLGARSAGLRAVYSFTPERNR